MVLHKVEEVNGTEVKILEGVDSMAVSGTVEVEDFVEWIVNHRLMSRVTGRSLRSLT